MPATRSFSSERSAAVSMRNLLGVGAPSRSRFSCAPWMRLLVRFDGSSYIYFRNRSIT